MRRLNWIIFPVMYPIAVLAGLTTMLLFRITFGWCFSLRWYMDAAYRLTISIITENPEGFFGRPS